MPIVGTAELVAEARAAGRGIGAFNVITLEHAEAIRDAAERAGLPAILQVSENAVKYHGGQLAPISLACAQIARESTVPLSLHIDHVEDWGLLVQAPKWGYSSAMFDASKLPIEENITRTAAAVEFGAANGLWIESELGEIGGKDGAHAPGVRTDPHDAAMYVERTGVQALAVAVGSSHAMAERTAALDHELIARIAALVPVPLVLHGSSGVPDDELVRAIRAGMVKINIGTALNKALTGAVREVLAESASLSDPRKYLTPGRVAMADTVEAMIRLLAS